VAGSCPGATSNRTARPWPTATWLRPRSRGGTISILTDSSHSPLHGLTPAAPATVYFGKLELSAVAAQTMSNSAIVAMLMESGTSRLSAERIVEVEREGADAGRARSHPQSRR
jgi:hypothetical protein